MGKFVPLSASCVRWGLVPLCFLGLLLPMGQAQTAGTFVSITPCRVIDTRETARGALGAPSLVAGAQRAFPVLSGVCHLPGNILAYALNITVVPHGPLGYLTAWPAGQTIPTASTLNSPLGSVAANAAIVPAGSNGAISVFATGSTELIVDINGYFAPQSTTAVDRVTQQVTQLSQQVTQLTSQITQLQQQLAQTAAVVAQVPALTQRANQSDQTLSQVQQQVATLNSTATQVSQLVSSVNTLTAAVQMSPSKQGVAVGPSASLSGDQSTSVGYAALTRNVNGTANTALGASALAANTTGSRNVGMGVGALGSNDSGSSNIAIGFQAGSAAPGGSNNIVLGNIGQPSDTGTIRIGDVALQTNTFIAGIYQAQVDIGSQVLVDENGQLGTIQSSQRYKENIKDIAADRSADLLKLRPVSFRYKQAAKNGNKPLQYGLIAEEVATVFPELVVRDKQGQVQTVQYHLLPALLLSQVQRDNRILEEQRQTIRKQDEQLQSLQARTAALETNVK